MYINIMIALKAIMILEVSGILQWILDLFCGFCFHFSQKWSVYCIFFKVLQIEGLLKILHLSKSSKSVWISFLEGGG